MILLQFFAKNEKMRDREWMIVDEELSLYSSNRIISVDVILKYRLLHIYIYCKLTSMLIFICMYGRS